MFSVSFLPHETLEEIHEQTMELLLKVGVDFLLDEALEIFASQGFSVCGTRVRFEEKPLMELISQAPSSFTLQARNPEQQVEIGGGKPLLVPGYGAPFVVDLEGNNRGATQEDFRSFAALAYLCDVVDVTGGTLVEPQELSKERGFLEKLYLLLTCSDKPIMGSSLGRKGAQGTLQLLSHVFTRKEAPHVITLINSLSPLKYDGEMLGAAIKYAQAGQALIITSLMMAGSTGPTTLAGSLVLQNAEVLAGIALTQLIHPGTPVLYGSASSITDMLTGSLASGSPETSLFTAASAQLGHFYQLPVRGGGAVSDSKVLDAQAAYESQLAMLLTQLCRIDYALHSFGILQHYNAMSLEKFILDVELAERTQRLIQGFSVEEEDLALELIEQVGPGGEFLTSEHTLLHYRQEFYMPDISDRQSYDSWKNKGMKTARERAQERVSQLLKEYTPPPMEEGLDAALLAFIQKYDGKEESGWSGRAD